ncbi:MAG: helix-turn-helix domain-containing protein [Rhodobacter sp.]|nr:helix-turn-helix domain-containing protein [Rhodobacter sp.]
MSFDAMKWALGFAATDMSEKAILLVLAGHADEFGYCWPSQATVARQACGSVRKVRSVIVELSARGLIVRMARQRDNGSRQSDAILLVGCPDRKPLPPGGHPTLKFGPQRLATGTPCRPPPAQRAATPRHSVPGPPAYCAALESVSESKKETTTAADTPLELCLAALGPAVDSEARTAIARTEAEIERWLAGGCDLSLDALPVIAARTAKARSSPILTFAYFTPAVFEAAARRRAAADAQKEDCHEHEARPARISHNRRSIADALRQGWAIASAKTDRP